MKRNNQIAPDWTICDTTSDLSDNLADVCDVARDWGHECTGYFMRDEVPGINSHHEAVQIPVLNLVGVSVDRSLGRVTYYGLEEAISLLGADAVGRIEGVISEMEAVL